MTTDAEINQLLAEIGEYPVSRDPLSRLTKLIGRLLLEREKWKALAEFQYGCRKYPEDVGVARGSLDAYYRREWDNVRYLQFLEQAQQAADRGTRTLTGGAQFV